ncbi:MAG: hypothetical protein ACJ77K_04705 [Bacteroidia bacterium]
MFEFFSEYHKYFIYAVMAVFGIFWISIPWYLSECAKTARAIHVMRKFGHLEPRDLNVSGSNWNGLEYAFGWLPNEITHPECFRSKVFREHIAELKKLKRFYLKAMITVFLFVILAFALRIYVVHGRETRKHGEATASNSEAARHFNT